MKESKNRFSVKIAEKEFQIETDSSALAALCKDYLCETKRGQIPILVTDEDVQKEKNDFLEKNIFSKVCKKKQSENIDPDFSSSSEPFFQKAFFESFALHRKISTALVEYKTVLFHGSAISINNKGIIFAAPSGTGKSTHSEKWNRLFGAKYVNDDKPYISIRDEILVHGSPWNGEHRLGSNVSVPLAVICIICRGTENKIEKIPKSEAFSEILKQTYMPKDSKNAKETFSLISKLSLGVEIYKLFCNMEDEAAYVSFNALSHFFENS